MDNMDIQKLAQHLATVVGAYACDIKMVVRDGEIYIDAAAPRYSHNVDGIDPGFRKLELTVKLR